MLVIEYMRLKNKNPAGSAPWIDADSKFQAIAAASIIAKTYRDKLMTKLHNDLPEYKWISNK